jgi:hypothetical protein
MKAAAPLPHSKALRASPKPENNPGAGNDVMTRPNEEVGLTTYVVSELQPQGQMLFQPDVGPASVIPGKIEASRRGVG